MAKSGKTASVLLLNGPNLNLLGTREPHLYGRETLVQIERRLATRAKAAGVKLQCVQTNHEGVLVDWVQEGRADSAGIVINAAGYTHTSVALRDALAACRVPRVEVHISDIRAREEFRRFSYLADVCDHHVVGHGVEGYREAVATFRKVMTERYGYKDVEQRIGRLTAPPPPVAPPPPPPPAVQVVPPARRVIWTICSFARSEKPPAMATAERTVSPPAYGNWPALRTSPST